ncbi:hypothetical protein JK636_04935 [Clostridium sp. YIM B02515]|uniref:Uncharacterized protein n=1 Tax=Clostridium rhizosphaerae TaxID=2803861 RepID=A0ABS1T6Y4_9CLOT|nr:hypothetical protein [Clostridium rhizosphaerae]MBL4935100.1 hypothetical protein [Clostridium rhizosphaerae]
MSQGNVYELKVPIDESKDHLLKWMVWTKKEPEDIDKKLERIRSNEKNDDGTRKKDMIWVLFKEEYENSKLKDLELESFDAAQRKILQNENGAFIIFSLSDLENIKK